MNPISRTALNLLLAAEKERLEKAIITQQELAEPGSHQVGDEADQALTDAEKGKHKALLEHLNQLLDQVQSARERLAAGAYGICIDCRQPIPKERLEALPYATLCVGCQSKREKKRPGRQGIALLAQH